MLLEVHHEETNECGGWNIVFTTLGKTIDESHAPSPHQYKLTNRQGTITIETPISGLHLNKGTVEVPLEYSLSSAYPNPFNPITTIAYSIKVEGHVTLTVYDLMGRAVETLVNTVQPYGKYQVSWNATNYSSGVYFVKLVSGDYQRVQKLMLVK